MSRYREKTCPTCATVHKKRGPYCSRSCGNARVHTDEHKEHLAKKSSEAYHSGATKENTERWIAGGILARKKALNKGDEDLQDLTYEDLFVAPVVRSLPNNQFVAGGDLWTEDD